MSIYAPFLPGTVVQTVTAGFSAAATTTTRIPFDDTIPQNTEGAEFMTLAITPLSSTNTLVIIANVIMSDSVVNNCTAALFQDSGANAIAASVEVNAVAAGNTTIPIIYSMTAGTTSSTTFKVRGGGSLAGTTTFNGSSGTRVFGAITKSSMTIFEIKV